MGVSNPYQWSPFWDTEISQMFWPGSRCSVARRWADLGSRGGGEKMWDRNDISDWFWLPTLGKNMPVFVFFPIFALDSPQIWTHHAVMLLFEVQWVAQARSQIMTRSVNMVHSIVVFESCESVFPKPVAHNMFHAMLFENMTDICFHVHMHAYCLTYVWSIDRLR